VQSIILQEKLYGKSSLNLLEVQLRSLCEGLQVLIKVAELTDRGWVRVNISGEDETAALNLLMEKFGSVPVELRNVKMRSVQKGKVVAFGKNNGEVYVDIGVFVPRSIDASISLRHLQARLADGKKLSLQRITKLFCLVNNFPLRILVKRLDNKRNLFVAELSEKQIAFFSEWACTNLERLIVIGAFFENVEEAVKLSGHLRDVAEIESLGLLDHVVVCKLGTYAAGLIPKVGRLLPNAVLEVFSPKEIQKFTEAFC
jgi:hypothetical protein